MLKAAMALKLSLMKRDRGNTFSFNSDLFSFHKYHPHFSVYMRCALLCAVTKPATGSTPIADLNKDLSCCLCLVLV